MSKPTFAEAERLFRAGDPSARDALEPLALAQHPAAARLLGELYRGQGEAAVEACLWFALAAELGDAEGAARFAECAGPLGAEQRARLHIEHTVLRGRVFGDPEQEVAGDAPTLVAEEPFSGPAPNSGGFGQVGRSLLGEAQGALQRFQQRLRERAAAQQAGAPAAPESGAASPEDTSASPESAATAPLAEDPFAAFRARAAAALGQQQTDPYAHLSAGQAPAPPPPPAPAPPPAPPPPPDPAVRGEGQPAELRQGERPVEAPGFLRPFGTPAPEPEPEPKASPEEEDWLSPEFTDPWLKPGKGAPRSASGRLRLKRCTVVDSSGFGEPMEAYSILIPSGWEGQGSVRWVQSFDVPANTVQLSFHASTPDGRTGFSLFPTHTWTHSNMGFGPVGPPPLGAVGYVEQMLLPRSRNHVENLRVLERTPLPEVARSIWEGAAAQVRGMPGMELKVDSAQVRIAYRFKGVDYEEWIDATTQCVISSLSMPGMGLFGFGMPQVSKTFVITAERLTGFHAPAGELEQYANLLATIRASGRADPRWSAAVNECVRNLGKIQSQGARERAAIRRKSFQEISAMRQDTWEKQQASRDKMHKKVIQSIRGVETWVDPTTGERLELDQGAKGAWRNALGEVVITDNVVDADRELLNWHKLRRPPE